jgi:predicted RNase H-like HicB family nuclease
VIKNLEVIIDEWIETAKELGREVPAPVDVAGVEEARSPFKTRLQPAV